MGENELTIVVAGKERELRGTAFAKFLLESIEGLRSVERLRSRPPRKQAWIIVRMGMNTPASVTLRPRSPEGGEAAFEWVRGLRLIETERQIPLGWDSDVLHRARAAIVLLADGLSSVKLSIRDEVFSPTLAVVSEIDSHLERKSIGPYQAFTTLIGRLDAINIHDRERPAFGIYDPLTDRPVTCDFKPEDIPAIVELLKTPTRVSVYGLAKYSKKGTPDSIEVFAYSPLPSRSEAERSYDKLKPVDVADGEDPVDYIVKVRRDE